MPEIPDFPSNSMGGQEPPEKEPEDKKIEQIVFEEPKRRKTPISKRFSKMFFGGDAKTAGKAIVFDVMVPAAKDLMVEAGSQLVERMIYGETRRRRGAPPTFFQPQRSQLPTNYTGYSSPTTASRQPQISRRARQQHDFDEIIMPSRQDAEAVLSQMYELLSKWEGVSIADLYTMVGIRATHVDNKWGWTNLDGAGVAKLRGGGFLLELPEPRPI